MAQRNALVNRLTAVETLGATRIIFTDKTGTLTENKMTLDRIATSAGDHKEKDAGNRGDQNDKAREKLDDVETGLLERVLRIAVLCNGATLGGEDDGEETSGDPTEIALLIAGRNHDMGREKLLEEYPEKRVVDFDPNTIMMATFHNHLGQNYLAVKGAPSAVFDVCQFYVDANHQQQTFDDKTRKQWDERVEKLADQGLRMLAVADKTFDCDNSEIGDAEPYEQLQLVGLVGLLDPPRNEVKAAINRCQAAGIRLLMVTGDQTTTGRAIGQAVGIGDDEDAPAMHGKDLPSTDEMTDEYKQRVLKTVVFARVSPEQKLNLVDSYQQRGESVAMTGDGVNDAPAIKKADIGIAMDQRETDAAKQTADMILQDDSFETIA